jgi:cytoskeletal protein CcmA (bactofilin family)
VSDQHGLSGLLGAGAHWNGDLTFDGRVRIDGIFNGCVTSDDLLEVGPTGQVAGDVVVAQALIAGTVEGILTARERVTLLETARVRGKIVTPWLDARPGCRIEAEVVVTREGTP